MFVTSKIDKKRPIGSAAKEVGVQEHVIRFWESQFPNHIVPTIGLGGRRYYYDKDVEILLTIKDYLHNKGYTIKGLQSLLESGGFDLIKLQNEEPRNTQVNNKYNLFEENNKININKIEKFENYNEKNMNKQPIYIPEVVIPETKKIETSEENSFYFSQSNPYSKISIGQPPINQIETPFVEEVKKFTPINILINPKKIEEPKIEIITKKPEIIIEKIQPKEKPAKEYVYFEKEINKDLKENLFNFQNKLMDFAIQLENV